MCGIGFTLEPCQMEQSAVESYLKVLRKRGPDADTSTLIQLEVRAP